MSWWKEFASVMECDVPLGCLTWFRVGGPARYMFRPTIETQLAALVERARQEGVPVKVLGGGANVLISDDGFDGVVVRLDSDAFTRVEQDGTTLSAGAGVDLMPLARRCSEQGLSGLEGLAGIPGTVGGAIRMNAGGRFGEFGSLVSDVDILRNDGTIERRGRNQLEFGYRRSDVGDGIVLSARLELTQDDPGRVKRTYEECFAYKKASQPLAEHSAGCVFKNPPARSAGAVIEEAGLKGIRCGGAHVSKRHANFIITDRDATASDVLRLIDLVQERVLQLLGTELELELDVWEPVCRQYA